MFCPRCSTPINEQLKFCRSCGLPVTQVTSYVASGGTQDLVRPPMAVVQPDDSSMTPLQKMILKILALLAAPFIVAMLSDMLGFGEEVAIVPAVFMPFGILIAVFKYRTQKRRLRELNPTGEEPKQVAQVTEQRAISPKETNPLEYKQPASVIEEETIRLPRES